MERYSEYKDSGWFGKRIEEVLQDECIAICVFDADVSTWNEVERKKLDALRKKHKDNPSVLLCDSMPSIEFLVPAALQEHHPTLWHFESRDKRAAETHPPIRQNRAVPQQPKVGSRHVQRRATRAGL